jgi:hypothetical protein
MSWPIATRCEIDVVPRCAMSDRDRVVLDGPRRPRD